MNHQIASHEVTADTDIEKNLERLETLIKNMESKQLKLEESLLLFEEGLKIIKSCQQILSSAELKVKELTKQPE